MLDEEGQRWASWGRVRDGTWMGSDHNKEYISKSTKISQSITDFVIFPQ